MFNSTGQISSNELQPSLATSQRLKSTGQSPLEKLTVATAVIWNSKVHYRVHNSPSPVPFLKKLNQVYILSPYLLTINIYIFAIATQTRSSKCFPLTSFPTNPPCVLHTRTTHALNLITLIII